MAVFLRCMLTKQMVLDVMPLVDKLYNNSSDECIDNVMKALVDIATKLGATESELESNIETGG